MTKTRILVSALALILLGTPQAVRAESFAKVRQNMAAQGERLCYWEVRVLSIHLGPGSPPEGTYSLQDLNELLRRNPEWEPFSASQWVAGHKSPDAPAPHTVDIILRRRVCN